MKYVEQKKKIQHLLARGKKNKVITILEKELAKNIDSGINSLILYELFISEKNEEDAIAILEQIQSRVHLLKESHQFDIYWHLGYLYFKNQKYKRAFFYLNKAYLKKKMPNLLAKIGQIYLEVDKLESAGKVFTFLYKNNPENNFYKAMLGYYFIKKGLDLKAEKILIQILDENPGHEYANYYLGYYFYTKKIYDSAIENFAKIKKNNDLKYKTHYYIGLIWEIRNDRAKAIEHFTICLKNIDYENQITLDMRYNLATQYEQILDFKSALEQFKIIYTYDPLFRDVAGRLISENYSKIRNTFLMDYNTLSNENYLKYVTKLTGMANLHPLQHIFMDKAKNILLFQCEIRKMGHPIPLFPENVHIKKGQNIPVIFFRMIHIKGNMLQDVIKEIPFSYNKGVVLSSGLVSPLSVHDAHEHNFTVILPTQLNRIIRKYPVR